MPGDPYTKSASFVVRVHGSGNSPSKPEDLASSPDRYYDSCKYRVVWVVQVEMVSRRTGSKARDGSFVLLVTIVAGAATRYLAFLT